MDLTRLCRERQMALLLISHDLAMVGEYCDRIAVMYKGQMVETGLVGTILRHPEHEYTRSLLQAALHVQAVDNQESGVRSQELGVRSQELKEQSLSPTSNTSPLLRVKDLKQHYTLESNFVEQLLFKKEASAIKAVDGVSFELYPGE